MARRGKRSERIADWLTDAFGTLEFFLGNAALFIFWIVVNVGGVPGVPIFDPFPFNFLTMFVSLEAIFLSVIVLISQSRAAKIDDLREQLDYEVNVKAEKEILKILRKLDRIERKMNK